MKILLLFMILSVSSFGRYISWTDLAAKQTTDATQTELHLITVPDGQTWLVTATCHASGANIESFKKSASISQSGASTTKNGDTVDLFDQPSSPYALDYGTTGGLQILGTGAAADTVTWNCFLTKERLI